MKIRLFTFLIFLFFISCERELEDFKTKNLSDALVIYGEVTNLPGPYIFRINTTTAYSAYDVTQFQGKPVERAQVKIIENDSREIQLLEINPGMYQAPNDFIGQNGKYYQLEISTTDGLLIRSSKELLQESTEIQEFNASFINSDKVSEMHFNLNFKIKDTKNKADFYFLKRQDFIEFLTTCPPPPPPPAPPPECKSKCWSAPSNSSVILMNDFLIDGQNIPIDLKEVPYNDFTNFVVEMNLYHINEAAYQYWKRMEEQRKIGNGLFDKIPAQIIGNLSCTNADRQILGYFLVAGKTKQRLMIDRFNDVPKENFDKLVEFVNFNNIRYKNYPIWDCKMAGWVNYNIGYELPPL